MSCLHLVVIYTETDCCDRSGRMCDLPVTYILRKGFLKGTQLQKNISNSTLCL